MTQEHSQAAIPLPETALDEKQRILGLVINAALDYPSSLTYIEKIGTFASLKKIRRIGVNLADPINTPEELIESVHERLASTLLAIGLKAEEFKLEHPEKKRYAGNYIPPDKVGIYVNIKHEALERLDLDKAHQFLKEVEAHQKNEAAKTVRGF